MAGNIKLLHILETLLRVPPLIVIDQIILYQTIAEYHGWSGKAEIHPFFDDAALSVYGSRNLTENIYSYVDSISPDYENLTKDALLPVLGKYIIISLGVLISMIIFLLSWKKLLKVYTFFVSVFILVVSYQSNMASGKIVVTLSENGSHPSVFQSLLAMNSTAIWDTGGMTCSVLFNELFQGFLAVIFCITVPVNINPIFKTCILFNFILPTFLFGLPVPSFVIYSTPIIASILPLCILKYVLISNVGNCLVILAEGYSYCRMVLSNYGLHTFLESEWNRLNVSNVFRTFWLIRTFHHIFILVNEYSGVDGNYAEVLDLGILYEIFKSVMTEGCATMVAVLGMTSIVSLLSHYMGIFLQYFMMYEDTEERSMANLSAVLFFVLAGQGSLTVLPSEKRYERLCRNFAFLFSAMLHFTHDMLSPVLMALSVSCNRNKNRHFRAIFVSALLIVFPCFVLMRVWNLYPVSTWLISISTFSVQVILKTFITVLVYALFLLDAKFYMFKENLNDYIFYLRLFGNYVEILFGTMLFFTGAFIYLFEAGSTFKAIVMCVHAHFNIWCEAKNGWSVFMKRKAAVAKLKTLEDAIPDQILVNNDVCAICFDDLEKAKITKCKHFFHEICLRRWLYIQDSCPLCFNILYNVEYDDNCEATAREDSDTWSKEDVDVILGEDLDKSSENIICTDNAAYELRQRFSSEGNE